MHWQGAARTICPRTPKHHEGNVSSLRGYEAIGLGYSRGRSKGRITSNATGEEWCGQLTEGFNSRLGEENMTYQTLGAMLVGGGREGKKGLSGSCMKGKLYVGEALVSNSK